MNVKISSPTSQALSKEEFDKFIEYAKYFSHDCNDVSVSCNFGFTGHYADKIEAFHQMFPNIDVSALIAYILFESEQTETWLKSKGIGNDDGITVNDLAAIGYIYTWGSYGGGEIFKEFRYFTGNLTLPHRWFYNGGPKVVYYPNTMTKDDGILFYATNVETVVYPKYIKSLGGGVYGSGKLKNIFIWSIKSWLTLTDNQSSVYFNPMCYSGKIYCLSSYTDADKFLNGDTSGVTLVTEIDMTKPDETFLKSEYGVTLANATDEQKANASLLGITNIPAYNQYNNKSLTKFVLHSGVLSIGNYAFANCSSLNYFGFGGTKSDWSNITLGDNWKNNAPFTIVHCSDGDVTL